MTAPTIDTGASLSEFQANYVPASQVLDSLAEQSDYWWKIDKNRDLYFLPREANTISKKITSSDIRGIPRIKNGNPVYRNVQYIKGSTGLTDAQTEVQKGDGDKRSFTVGYALAEQPSVSIDRGSGYVYETVATKSESEGADWFWQLNDNTITQNRDNAVLSATDKVRVEYVGQFPSVVVATDNDAVTAQQQLELITTGRVEDALTEDISGRDRTLQFANSKLAKYAQNSTTLSFQTQYTGFESGQLATVNSVDSDIDGEQLLITKVNLHDENGQVFYDVEAVKGPRHKTWEEFFKELTRRSELTIREGLEGDQVLVIPYEYTKNWTTNDEPNIFRRIFPELGLTFDERFDTSLTWNDYSTEEWSASGFTLFPSTDLYPSFDFNDRVAYIEFERNGDTVFRKKYANRSPVNQTTIESEYYIGPEEFTGTINDIVWYGGIYATNEEKSGVEIDRITFDDSKNELEAYQISRTDIKDGDY